MIRKRLTILKLAILLVVLAMQLVHAGVRYDKTPGSDLLRAAESDDKEYVGPNESQHKAYDWLKGAAKPKEHPYPIYVPRGVAVVSIRTDDTLENSWKVLYKECMKRGFPITQTIPGVKSAFISYDWTLMTDTQVVDTFCRGGANFQYHSTSHWDDLSLTNLDYWIREAGRGFAYGEGDLPTSNTNYSGGIIAAADTLGNRWATAIAANGEVETGRNLFETAPATTGALYLKCQGFAAPGQWWGGTTRIYDLPLTSPVWDFLENTWGDAVFLIGGKTGMRPGDNKYLSNYMNWDENITDATFTAMIDNLIERGGRLTLLAHDYLESGETGAAGEGSAEEGATPWGQATTYTHLTTRLNYLQTKMQQGKLMVLGDCAMLTAKQGTPINLLPSVYMTRAEDGTTGIPPGWCKIAEDTTIQTAALNVLYRGNSDITPAYTESLGAPAFKLTVETDATTRYGFMTSFVDERGTQSYILSGYVRCNSVANDLHLKVIIYGGTMDDTLTIDGTDYYSVPNSIREATQTLGGWVNQPLYEYVLDGIDCQDTTTTETYFQIPFGIPAPLSRIGILFTVDSGADGEQIYLSNIKVIPNGA